MTGDELGDRATVDVDRFEHLPVLTILTTVDNDGVPILEDCNDQFARRLGRTRSELSGHPLETLYASEVLPIPVETPGQKAADGSPTADGGTNVPATARGSEDTGNGPLEAQQRDRLESASSLRGTEERAGTRCTLADADGTLVRTIAEAFPRAEGVAGYVIFHIDVTRRYRREQQADVLNRLMRHNLRNDINLLRGHANTLTNHDDEEVVDSAEVLDRIADRWLGLAETARNIERLFDDVPTKTVHLADVTTSAYRWAEREWEDGRIEIECDVDTTRRVSDRLHVALVELCENGFKHHEETDISDGPLVRIEIEPADRPGWIVVHVIDHGPAIPPHELAALHAEEETPLQHGGGLGFWLVKFVVSRLGGDVTAKNCAGGGSVVSLTVPLADG